MASVWIPFFLHNKVSVWIPLKSVERGGSDCNADESSALVEYFRK